MRSMTLTAMAVILCAGSAASAEFAYNNFGPGDTYDLVNHQTFKEFSASTIRFGQQFLSGATGEAGVLKIVAFNQSGDPSAMLRLFADSGSDTLGSQIGDAVTFTTAADNSVITTLDVSGANWEFTAGQKYWLVAQSIVNRTTQNWAYNSIGDASGATVTFLGQDETPDFYTPPGGTPLGVFSIEIVPTPAGAALLGLGGFVALGRRRGRTY